MLSTIFNLIAVCVILVAYWETNRKIKAVKDVLSLMDGQIQEFFRRADEISAQISKFNQSHQTKPSDEEARAALIAQLKRDREEK